MDLCELFSGKIYSQSLKVNAEAEFTRFWRKKFRTSELITPPHSHVLMTTLVPTICEQLLAN